MELSLRVHWDHIWDCFATGLTPLITLDVNQCHVDRQYWYVHWRDVGLYLVIHTVMFSSDSGPISLLSVLSSTISIPLPYHSQITSDCLVHISYPLSPPIVDPPLHYLVALCLSPCQCLSSYHVRYIGPQSGGTVGLGLRPLCSLALTRSESTSSI